MISKKEVEHIAKLARIGLTSGEIEKFQKELSSILDYFEKLEEVDVSEAEPISHPITRATASSTELENVTRKDEVRLNGASVDEAEKLLDLVPDKKNGYVKVRAILK